MSAGRVRDHVCLQSVDQRFFTACGVHMFTRRHTMTLSSVRCPDCRDSLEYQRRKAQDGAIRAMSVAQYERLAPDFQDSTLKSRSMPPG